MKALLRAALVVCIYHLCNTPHNEACIAVCRSSWSAGIGKALLEGLEANSAGVGMCQTLPVCSQASAYVSTSCISTWLILWMWCLIYNRCGMYMSWAHCRGRHAVTSSSKSMMASKPTWQRCPYSQFSTGVCVQDSGLRSLQKDRQIFFAVWLSSAVYV